MTRLAALGLLAAVAASLSAQAPQPKAKQKKAPRPPEKPRTVAAATPGGNLKVLPGFRVELLYTVPKETQGSWVSICHLPDGRLIVSDQYGALYRVSTGAAASDTKVEKLDCEIGGAQGLLWAFNSLYVVVNDRGDRAGLYRVAFDGDTPGKVTKLRAFKGAGGEHGCHAVLLTPDGKRLTVVCGNQTQLTPTETSRVPRLWGDDHLLPRVPDGNGFMKDTLGPGGFVFTCDPEGKDAELVSVGFRNQYDAAYNRDGELFAYDADMEWDFNTPWYRPTRVCHVTSGSEWGWRNGAGKYPVHYPDNLPPVVDIGPGSPTGVCFGYGAKFPKKYQDAFFICDWSYGKLYAVHLKPKGASYEASAVEEFITGTPLPLTDLVINPKDGAMYFAVGGRKTQSGLYRVTHVGEPARPSPLKKGETHPLAQVPGGTAGTGGEMTEAEAKFRRDARHLLETFHGKPHPQAVATAWKKLGDPDRFIRWAARTAIESQPVSEWRDKALTETEPQAALEALLALTRASAACPLHAKDAKPDPAAAQGIIQSLSRLNWNQLTAAQRVELVRIYQILLHRFGKSATAEDQYQGAQALLEKVFPTGDRYLDGMLLETLVFMGTSSTTAIGMKLLADAPTQEEQIEYARSLRMAKTGWTPQRRADYFKWFVKAAGYKGGSSFAKFLNQIKADAVALLTESEKQAIQPILDATPTTVATVAAPPRPFVKKWTTDDLVREVSPKLTSGRDFDKGRKLFAAVNCFGCHRYANEGGSTGPDLTGIAGRFNTRDLLESMLDPSKEVSDQYAAVEIETADGRKVVGRIVNLNENGVSVLTDMLNPNGITNLNRNVIEQMKPSKLSMMPTGLLDSLTADEAADLLAYLLSRGDRSATMFKR